MLVFHEEERRMNVMGDSIKELVDYALPRIRPQSKEFYGHDIPRCLDADGTTLIDCHAIGIMTRLYLDPTVARG